MSDKEDPAAQNDPPEAIVKKAEQPTKKPEIPANFTLVHTLTGHTRAVVCVQYSPDGSILASASGDNTCKLWSSASGQLLQTLEGHTKVPRFDRYHHACLTVSHAKACAILVPQTMWCIMLQICLCLHVMLPRCK